MPHFEETISSKLIFKGKVLEVRHDEVRLENGEKALREVVYHNGGVCVLPLCDNGDVIFVKQFRYPYKEEVLELPAGKLNIGENPFESGKRELLEETGAVAGRYTDLGKLYVSPGYASEVISLYLAEDLTFSEQRLDEDEFLDVIRIPFEKALEMVMKNEIVDSKSQVAILKTAQLKNKPQE